MGLEAELARLYHEIEQGRVSEYKRPERRPSSFFSFSGRADGGPEGGIGKRIATRAPPFGRAATEKKGPFQGGKRPFRCSRSAVPRAQRKGDERIS